MTQEDPASQRDGPGAGGNPTGAAGLGGSGLGDSGSSGQGLGGSGFGNAGSGGTGQRPPGGGSGLGGGVAAGSTGNGGTSSGAAGSGAVGGSSGAGQGGSGAAPGPQFPSGTELLRDDFESDDVSRWILAGGAWTRALDAETSSNVFSQSDDGPSAVLLAVSGDVSWRDVRVEADFKVLAFNGSSSSYLAGLCVRLADPENFYLVGLRGDSNQHIGIRKFGSSNTNLAESEFSGEENVWYHLRVDAIGSTLSVFVDDALVLEQSDVEHPAGGIGLCTARATAVFDNILVTAP